MTACHDTLKPVGTATFANLIGRAANVILALTVVALRGTNSLTELSVALSVPFSLVLRQWMGIPGIALATTLIHFVNCILLVAAVHAGRYQNRL